MMYKTKKIRIQGSEQTIQHLLQYEQCYHHELLAAIQYVKQNPIHTFSNLSISKKIACQNQWYLYRIALRKSKHAKWSIGSLSSRWQPMYIRLDGRKLYINLNEQHLLMLEMEEEFIINKWLGLRMLHVDLLHEDLNWSVCFLFTIKGMD